MDITYLKNEHGTYYGEVRTFASAAERDACDCHACQDVHTDDVWCQHEDRVAAAA